MKSQKLLYAVFTFAVAAGCGASAEGPGDSMTSGGGESGADTGLPCDVQDLLKAHCTACHGNPPTPGTPMPLVTYADLMAPAKTDPSKTAADVALARMKSTTAPMPPGAPLPPDQIAVLDAWLTAGAPQGSCGGGGGGEGGGAPVACTSDVYWTDGDDGSELMHPGRACIQCHSTIGGVDPPPGLLIGGTVYPSQHEPDECFGAPAAVVEITDAAGKIVTLTTNASGNFHSLADDASLTLPIKAKVLFDGKTRAMTQAVASGDCNSCHTEQGANGAPGRIMSP